MTRNPIDLFAAAREEMIREGFEPDFPPEAVRQLDALKHAPAPAINADIHDLRSLLWSSIDNDTSRDLDQAEVAERSPDRRFVASAPAFAPLAGSKRL